MFFPTHPFSRYGLAQEYEPYKDRVLKMENQLVNALGFDFMIEHPYNHYAYIYQYLVEEGEARELSQRCVPCGCLQGWLFHDLSNFIIRVTYCPVLPDKAKLRHFFITWELHTVVSSVPTTREGKTSINFLEDHVASDRTNPRLPTFVGQLVSLKAK